MLGYVSECRAMKKAGRSFKTSKINVLVVEDDQSNRELMQIYLKSLNYRVETAERPEQALELMQRDPDRFDLAYIDIHYAGTDMTGFDLVCEISISIEGSIPFFIMSMSDTSMNRTKATEIGAIDFLDKTFDDLERSIRLFHASRK